MTADADGCGPVGYETRDVRNYDRFAENGSIKDVTDGTVGRFPHLFKAKFLNACFIGRDGGTFDSNAVLTDGVGSINGNLVIGFVTVFDSEVEIFDVQVEVRENKFFLDITPNDAGHFISIQFHNRIGHLDFAHDIA